MNTDKYFQIYKIENIKLISKKELKRRWKILCKKYHPDKPGGKASSFRIIQEAYKYLLKIVENEEDKNNKKFFNKNLYFYGDGSIYDKVNKKWLKVKGKKV
jgi:curved DNA-binding protein CbpA